MKEVLEQHLRNPHTNSVITAWLAVSGRKVLWRNWRRQTSSMASWASLPPRYASGGSYTVVAGTGEVLDFGRNVAQWAINEGVPTPLNLILVQQKLQSSNSNRVNRNLTHALSLFHKPVPNLA